MLEKSSGHSLFFGVFSMYACVHVYTDTCIYVHASVCLPVCMCTRVLAHACMLVEDGTNSPTSLSALFYESGFLNRSQSSQIGLV